MSEDKNIGKPTEKKKRSNRIVRWFREMRSELKKVVWPTPKQVANNSLVVLAVTFVSAIGVWSIDFVGAQIFQAIRLFGVR